MTTLTTVPEGATALDVLATRYRIAFDKTQASREQWIEGTLELAVIVAEARKMIPDHREFSRWISRNRLEHFHPNEFAALKGFSQDLAVAREMLTKSNSISWRVIWEKRPIRTLTKIGKGTPRPLNRRTGSGHRERRNRIPDAMRDDDDQPAKPSAKQPRPEPKGVNGGKGLTREQVDPDFKGTDLEFATKYGHVNQHTKQEIERHKQQEKLSVRLGAMTQHARTARELMATDIDADTLRAWQQKTGKAEKWQAWCKDIALACEHVRKALD